MRVDSASSPKVARDHRTPYLLSKTVATTETRVPTCKDSVRVGAARSWAARTASAAEGASSSARNGEGGAAAGAAAGRGGPAGLVLEGPLWSPVMGAAAAAALPARVRIIAQDVQDAVDVLQPGAARARMRGDSGRTGGFFGKPTYHLVSRLTRYWYRH